MRKFARKTLALAALGIFLVAVKSYFWAFWSQPSERQSLYLLGASLLASALTPLFARGLMPGRLHAPGNYGYLAPWVEQFVRVLTLLFLISLAISLLQLRHGYPTVAASAGYLRHTGHGITVPIGIEEYWRLQRAVVRIFCSFAALVSGTTGLALLFHWEPPSRKESLL